MKKILLPIIATLFATVSFAQYNYDFGLKISSFGQNALQIEQRFHLPSSFILTANFTKGGTSQGYGINNGTSGDTIYNVVQNIEQSDFYTGRIGIAKRLTIANNNFFYVGTSVGIGYQEISVVDESLLTYYDENGPMSDFETGLNVTSENSRSSTFQSGAFYQLFMTFGMDIPISKRFSINCEANGVLSNRLITNSNDRSTGINLSVSGGLRYSFGKISQ